MRRNSLFDAAAAAAPVTMLDEHFRSAPHLIDVVARTLYGGRLHVATRTPVSERRDCVWVTPCDGRRESDGVIWAEVEAVLKALRSMAAEGVSSVGVLTPFRAQANELEAAILSAFSAAQLEQMDLRVGTVHSFQGNERDHILCSLGLVDGDTGGWRFVADPHLLAVMLTRARSTMRLFTSCTPEPNTLLGQYLAAADSPPGSPPAAAELSSWGRRVIEDLRLAGVTIATAYPTGRHVLDGAAARDVTPVAVVCELHPDGLVAHIDRHVALLRAGWEIHDALRTDWEDRLPELVIELAARIRGVRQS